MLTRIRTLVLLRALFASGIAALALAACDDPEAQVALETTRLQHGIPGIAAATITADSVTVYTSGTRRLGSLQRIGRDDLFHIGSDAKAMLATVVAREVE